MQKRLLLLLTTLFFILGLTQQSFAQYCTPYYYYGPIYGDFINGVELNTIDNYTGADDDYNDFTDISTSLSPGVSYTLYVDGGTYGDYYNAWIDYDGDEEFETTEKLSADDVYIYGGGGYDFDFTVPVTAIPGETRMRVMCVYYPSFDIETCPTASDYYYYGETEDYTINIPASGPYDLGAVDLTSIATGCGLSNNETVTVEIFNMGTESSEPFDVAFKVKHPVLGWLSEVVETYTGTALPTLTGNTFTFSATADLSTSGDYIIKVYTISATDGSAVNDTTTHFITSIPVITSYPYLEEYEAGSGGWIQYGTSSTWELGSPDGPVIVGAPPSTPSSENSWTTSLTDYYEYYEASYVEGPCFDFTSLVLPYVEFDIWWETYTYNDGAQLEYSLDAGTTWTLIGSIGSGDNWYTGTGYGLGYDPVTFIYENGWVGSSGEWKHAKHDLTFLAGESQVKFRFRFASTYYPYYDGIAFDNFKVAQPYPDDLGVIAVNTPASGTTLGTAEIVNVTVKNFGTNPQTNPTVYYQVNLGTIHSDTYIGTINPGETGDLTFTATEDFGTIGAYSFYSWTELTGDDDYTNDTLEAIIEHLTPVTGTAAYYIHLSTEDPFGSSDNIEKMDEVFGLDGWTEEFFDTMDPDAIFNVNTCFVYLEGGGYTAVEFANFLEENIETIQNWVSSGGNLLLNAAPQEGSNIDLGFGGVTLWNFWYMYSAEATDPDFPIFISPHTPVGTDWYGWWYSFAYARLSGDDMTGLINDYYYPTYYALGLKQWGEGEVLFGTMTPAEYHSPVEECSNLKMNMFEFLKYCSPIDLGVVELISPNPSGCGLTAEETVTVKIQNFGPTTVSSFPVKYSVDGAADIIEVASVLLESGATALFTFSEPVDLSALGVHTIEVWTDIYQDEDHGNDSLYIEVTNLEAPLVDLGPDLDVCDEIILDAGNPDMLYLWSTGETTQTITATAGGSIIATVTHPVTGCIVSDTINLDLTYTPAASFESSVVGLTVTFTNTSSPGALYTWYFGDGTTSNEYSPTHTFTANAYTVVLVAENQCGYSYTDTILYVGVDPEEIDAIENISLETRTVLYPNPATTQISVAMHFNKYYTMQFEVINSLGEIILIVDGGRIMDGEYAIDISQLNAGAYYLRISADQNKFMKPFVVIH